MLNTISRIRFLQKCDIIHSYSPDGLIRRGILFSKREISVKKGYKDMDDAAKLKGMGLAKKGKKSVKKGYAKEEQKSPKKGK